MATSKFTDWALVLKTNRINDLIVFKGSKWRNVHLKSYAPVLSPQRPVEMKRCGDDPIIIKEDIGCNGRQQQASKEKLWAFSSRIVCIRFGNECQRWQVLGMLKSERHSRNKSEGKKEANDQQVMAAVVSFAYESKCRH